MAVQFFGQFLIAHGDIDAADLRDALALMDRQNAPLGQLAIDEGLLTPADVARIHALQRSRDVAFGDLCVEAGLLGADQLVALLRVHNEHRLLVGEALVRLGHLAPDRLALRLDEFKADQAKYSIERIELPDGLANHRAAEPTLSFLARFALRVAGFHVKVGAIRRFDAIPGFARFRVSVPLHGVQGLDVALVSDFEFAESLALATTGLAAGHLDDELIADGVGEFLNVFLGNVVAALSVEGHPMRLGPPDYEADLVDGWLVDLAVDTGRAALVLSLF